MTLRDIYEFLVPQYITERVAVGLDDKGEYFVICQESEITHSDKPYIHGIGTIKTITWLWFCKGGWVELDDEL